MSPVATALSDEWICCSVGGAGGLLSVQAARPTTRMRAGSTRFNGIIAPSFLSGGGPADDWPPGPADPPPSQSRLQGAPPPPSSGTAAYATPSPPTEKTRSRTEERRAGDGRGKAEG